jgi:hypothetical protein
MNFSDITQVSTSGLQPEDISLHMTPPPQYSSASTTLTSYAIQLRLVAKLTRIKTDRLTSVSIADVKMTERTYPDLLRGMYSHNAFSSVRSNVGIEIFQSSIKVAINMIEQELNLIRSDLVVLVRSLFETSNLILLTSDYIESVVLNRESITTMPISDDHGLSKKVAIVSTNFDLFTRPFANEFHKLGITLEKEFSSYIRYILFSSKDVATLESMATTYTTSYIKLKAAIHICNYIYKNIGIINNMRS